MTITGAANAEVYLPRTKVHFQCRFPDGSYTEYMEREKWFFYAELFPHAQTTAFLDSEMKYVDVKGRRHLHVGTSDDRCIGVGKRASRLFFSGFENAQGQFVHFNAFNQSPDVPFVEWERFPKEIPVSPADQSAEIRTFMDKEFLYGGYRARVVPMVNDQTLLYEQPLTAHMHPSIPSDTVLYVYQSTSTDYGKTWSTPTITRNAGLFEVGRLITAQSWSAVVKTIVKDASKR